MSRSIQYQVTYKNGKRHLVAGLFNPHGADFSTSHFNGPEKDGFIKAVSAFEQSNKKQIKSRALWFNVSTSKTSNQWLNGFEHIEYAFPAFRKTLDRVFETVNRYEGGQL